MFRLIMPDRMREYLSAMPSAVTVTTNDLELPWELMYDNDWIAANGDAVGGFLCLERPIARMPMGRALPRTRLPTERKAKLRFLLIYADPHQNLPAAGREVELIESSLRQRWSDPAAEIDIAVLRGDHASGAKLNQALLSGEYDVIHFAGHAAFNAQDPDKSGLLLHGAEVFFSQKIQRMVEGQPLVFLNACETGRTANEDAPQSVGEYFWKPAEGLASAFLYGGALGCVGSHWPVYDEPAAEFAIEFYNCVLEGHMIGEAMRLARRKLIQEHPDSITWAAFVLYGDPTFRLVR
jgi:CHAT domain-containing protein